MPEIGQATPTGRPSEDAAEGREVELKNSTHSIKSEFDLVDGNRYYVENSRRVITKLRKWFSVNSTTCCVFAPIIVVLIL